MWIALDYDGTELARRDVNDFSQADVRAEFPDALIVYFVPQDA